jgi:hypothetical protein
MGYTSVLGAILTGQGSTNDVTLVNDADATVLGIPTGTTNVDIVGVATAATFEPDGDTSTGDTAAIGYTSAEGLILTGQGSTNDVTIKNDADADVIKIPTGTTNVTIVGDLTVTGDDIVMGTNTDTAILVADGTNFNPVVPSGDVSLTNAGVFGIASGVIVNADVNSSAAIADSKLATISTANKVALTALDLDGGTEIGAAIVDADLFIIDDGASGTNKKVLASRLKTYAGGGDVSAGNGSAGAPSISFSSDTDTGFFWSGTANTMQFSGGGTQRWHMDSVGHLFINDTGDANSVTGVTINQLAWDDQVLTFKSSDVAHGITSTVETDTYGALAKTNPTEGGLSIHGYGESNSQAIFLRGVTVSAANSTDSATGAQAVIEFVAHVKSGTGTTAVADAGNCVGVWNASNCRWLVKGNGDVHQTTDAHTALDIEDDTAVIRAFTKEISVKGVIETEFDQRMVRSREYLEEIGLLGHVTPEARAKGDKPLFNASLLMKFHDGAIWQTRAMVETLRSAEASYFDKLKSKIEECLTDLADRPVTLDIEDFGEFSTAALAKQQLPALPAFNK